MEQRPRWQPTLGAGPHVAARSPFAAVTPLIAFALAASFAVVLLGTLDFPLGTHADEPSKALAVLNNHNNYNHPLLMLHIVRAANAVAGLTDPQQVAELGRACAVLAGAAAIFLTFLLAREVLPAPAAVAAAAATAVTPLVAMHARYFKEDIFLLLFILLSLLALIHTLKSPTPARAILLGLAVGLAAATKYVVIVVLPFAVLVLLVGLSGVADRRKRLRLSALVALAAIVVFALIHAPIVWDFAQFKLALLTGLRQAETGHEVRAPVTLTYGLFHLQRSLLPGLGAPLLVVGLLGFITPWLAPPERRRPLLVIAAFAALWLVAHEISPFKPFPNFQRYMVPVVPLLVILGAAFVYELGQRRFPAWSTTAAIAAILAAAAPALYTSLRIAGPPEEDLRRIVPPVVVWDTPNAAFDHYTRLGGAGGQSAMRGTPPAEHTSILVTSNLTYDRYLALGAADLQPHETRARAAAYNNLFTHPYLELSNGRPNFAFFNPVLRIVALDGDVEHLKSLAAAFRRDDPDVSVTLVDAGASD